MNSVTQSYKKPAHTPGPWTVESGHLICSDEGTDGFVLAKVFSGQNSKADENLIAAAPDLLAALLEVVNVFDSNNAAIVDTVWVTGGSPETLRDLCASAIDKAMGAA